MKMFLLGLCTFLSGYCFAQNGKLALQLTQSTNFEWDCGLNYKDVAFGAVAIVPIGKRINASMGLNFRHNSHKRTYQIFETTFTSKDLKTNYLETPIALHYQIVQKEKFNVQFNLGSRQNFALKDTEKQSFEKTSIELTTFDSAIADRLSFSEQGIEMPIEMPNFEAQPSFESRADATQLKVVEKKGFTHLNTFFGLGMSYKILPTLAIGLNANFDFFHWNKQSKVFMGEVKNYWSSCLEIDGMRMQIGVIKAFN